MGSIYAYFVIFESFCLLQIICDGFASDNIRSDYRLCDVLPDNKAYPCTTPSDFWNTIPLYLYRL